MEESIMPPAPFSFASDNVFAAITWGGERVELRISYQAVCMASKVWRRSLLHPRLPNSAKEKDLPLEENPIYCDEEAGLKLTVDLGSVDRDQDVESNGELQTLNAGEIEEPEMEDVPAPPDADFFDELASAPDVDLFDELASAPDVDDLVEDKLDLIPAAKVSNSDGLTLVGNDANKCTSPRMQSKVLDLEEDDAEAVLVLLRIAHLQFHMVPNHLGFQLLLEVARLCDYYDCVLLVKPWLAQWLQDEEDESMKPYQEEWLLIAWVFGRDKVFSKLAASLVRNMEIDTDGKPVRATKIALRGELQTRYHEISIQLPLGILDSILEVRTATLKTLLDIVYNQIDRYSDPRNLMCRQGVEDCDSLVYGCLIRGLLKKGLWPKLNPEDILISIESVYSSMKEMRIAIFSQNYVKTNHSCTTNLTFKEELSEGMSSITDPALEAHHKHMEFQADLLDLDGTLLGIDKLGGRKKKKQ